MFINNNIKDGYETAKPKKIIKRYITIIQVIFSVYDRLNAGRIFLEHRL